MLLASTNCVGAVWWECIIILAPLLFFWNPTRLSRNQRHSAPRVCRSDRSLRHFSVHFDGKSAAPRRHILIHHRLVSLVLGLNSHVYSLWVAATQRSPSSSRDSKRESHVRRRAPGTGGARRDWSR